MDSFANRLSEAIKMRGISQAELARRAGIGRNSISDYIKGKYEAKQDYLSQLAVTLDVNESWLMGLDVPMERLEIQKLFEKLDETRKIRVINFAQKQLKEQFDSKNVSDDKDKSIFTLAAHSDDPDKKVTKESLDSLNAYLDELDAEYNIKNKNR